MKIVKKIAGQLNRQFFNSVVNNQLIYNSCWEDPRIDRKLLDIGTQSRMVMLTSAGCNALDYLLDEPTSVHCVDINPAQNALLELKRSLFMHDNYQTLWKMFGTGHLTEATSIYHQSLRNELSVSAQTFWDDKLGYFDSNDSSFYFHGTTGRVAQIIYNYIQRKGLNRNIINLLDAQTLAEQSYYFEEIEPHLWNPLLRWLLQRDTTMNLLGIAPAQREMVEKEEGGGLPAFIRKRIREVFTERPVSDNYFWRVYLTGSYTKSCCPNYLKEKNFNKISESIGDLTVNTSSLAQYLHNNSGPYSHFILLDHQDWMAFYQPEKLAEEWNTILSNACKGAKVLFRSAGNSRSFIPDFVHHHVHFQDKKTAPLHDYDRVGTYGSIHLAIIDDPL